MGWEVEPSRTQEDIRAELPFFGTFVIECKRPAGMAGVGRLILEALDQIKKRNRDEGMISIALDGVLGMSSDVAGALRYEEFAAAAREIFQSLWDHVRTYGLDVGTLWPEASIVGLILSTAVPLVEDATVLRFTQTALLETAGDERGEPLRKAIDLAVRQARASHGEY